MCILYIHIHVHHTLHSINRVTWHNGAIPENEVWLKLGGDKGGGTFKLCFQHLNVPSPNSPDNTCIFSMFEAPDSYTNIKIALEQYTDVLKHLETKHGGMHMYMYMC